MASEAESGAILHSSRRHRAAWGFLVAVVLIAIGWKVYTQRASLDRPGAAPVPTPELKPRRVVALGRLKPKGGVVRVAGPSQFAVVVARLNVEEGDAVRAGQILAVLDTHQSQEATVAQLEAELANSRRQWDRIERLYDQKIVSESDRDDQRSKVEVARAALEKARADLEQTVVRAPISSRVLKVHCRSGEKVGPEGIVELARTDRMYAVAEVYETDLPRIRVGQRARVSSPVLAQPLGGAVERIGRQIGKEDVLSTDPAARTDARVAEVEIRLDDSGPAAALTHLQVEITFE